MASSPRAVFISYASQDAEVAGHMCEALRAAGVEVWFDRTELRGGDAWDQSIKRQIRECSLFLPVISSSTQARREGYFRREWKLAVERTHDMDDGVPFLLPIALDGINESDAFVPEAFLRVQWTKLAAKEIPAAFVSRVRNLLEDPAPVRASGGGVLPPVGSVRSSRHGMPSWARGLIAVAGVGMGLFFAARGVWQEKKPRPPAPAPVTAPMSEVKPAVPAREKLDGTKIVVARFENLSSDPALDGVARIIEGELSRGIGAAPHVRMLPVEVSTRAAVREAARKENAASMIVGSYYRDGTNLLVSAEVVLVEQGTTLGTLGPVAVPTNVRSEAWTDFVDRLTTGANNAVANLESEPVKISGLVYTRPWPRWSVGLKLNQLRAENGRKTDEQMLAGYREMLEKYPELLRAKIEIARKLREMGRVDESEKEFNELLELRGQLSAYEVNELAYDLALLQGRPELALQAARGMIAIRETGMEITQVLASLWALNRPRLAYEEIKAWIERMRLRVPEGQLYEGEIGLMASHIAAELAHDELKEAEVHANEMREYAKNRLIPTVTWVQSRVLAFKGSLEPLKALIAEAGTFPADSRVEPVVLAFYAQGILLHRGFVKEAEEMDRFIAERWADLPVKVRESDDLGIIGWHVALLEKRYDDALARIDNYAARRVSPPVDVIGYRALTCQKAGREKEWRALDQELENMELRNQRGMPFYWRARLAAGNGEKKRATDLMEQAVANGLWFRSFQGGMSDFGRIESEFATLRGYAPYELLLKPKD